MQKISKFERTKAMETHFYTMEFFSPFTRIFLYTSRKISYNFFLCCIRISRVMNAQKSRNSRGKTRAMETYFYTMEFFSPFTRIFLFTSRKIPYNFFLCCVCISRVMNAKKSRNSKGKTRAMETHFYTMEFFCPFTRSFLYTSRKIPCNFFFLCCVRIPRVMNAKKSRNSRGKTRAMEIHFYTMDFFSLS